jgi:hypothetical protein
MPLGLRFNASTVAYDRLLSTKFVERRVFHPDIIPYSYINFSLTVQVSSHNYIRNHVSASTQGKVVLPCLELAIGNK